jgi:hypothetical protein
MFYLHCNFVFKIICGSASRFPPPYHPPEMTHEFIVSIGRYANRNFVVSHYLLNLLFTFFFHDIFIYMEYNFTSVFFMIRILLLRSYKLIENLRFILKNKTFKLTKYIPWVRTLVSSFLPLQKYTSCDIIWKEEISLILVNVI